MLQNEFILESPFYIYLLFIMLYKVVLTFESVDEILKCDHSNESYWAVLSCGTVYYAVQGGYNFRVSVDEMRKCELLIKGYWAFSRCAVYYAAQGGYNFWVCAVDEILPCDNQWKTSLAVFSYGTFFFSVFNKIGFEISRSWRL